jgi:hypothetical protein
MGTCGASDEGPIDRSPVHVLTAASASRIRKPRLSDPGNELVLLEFRDRLRQRVERGNTQATGGTASYLIDVLRILAEIEAENFNQPATQNC